MADHRHSKQGQGLYLDVLDRVFVNLIAMWLFVWYFDVGSKVY